MNDNKDLANLNDFSNSNIDFDDLDEEVKKSIEDKTLFVDEDGTIDESRGSGKRLTDKLRFFVLQHKHNLLRQMVFVAQLQTSLS